MALDVAIGLERDRGRRFLQERWLTLGD